MKPITQMVVVCALTILPSATFATEPVSALERFENLDPKQVALGARLFVDKQLSADGSVSCNSCHDLASNGADTSRFSIGISQQQTSRNTPTVFNAALNFRQFWDGRVRTLEEQAESPLISPSEMGNTWQAILNYLNSDTSYRNGFQDAFGTIASKTTVTAALAEFQRTLVTTDSRFDQYLYGNKSAITAEEKAGYDLFKNVGCTSCHQGKLLGGNIYEKLGVFESYYAESDQSDLGRYHITQKIENKFEFKVPGLRNVTLTPPYFHDGSVWSLPEAIKIMARHQSGIQLTDEDANLIEAFLKTLEARPQ